MSKYMIEIEDVPFSKVRIDADNGAQNINLYRAKGFNTLVFDEHGLDKLTSLDEAMEEAYHKGLEAGQHEATTLEYQQGLNDAWEAARKIAQQWEEDTTEYRVVMDDSIRVTLDSMTASEAIEKVKAYEQQKADAEIKVGDEVEAYSGRAVVFGTFTDTKGEKFCRYWYPSDDSFNKDKTENLKKTGRHFPQVAELIKAMKGKHRDCHTCKHKVVSSIECVDCRGFGKWEPKEGAE